MDEKVICLFKFHFPKVGISIIGNESTLIKAKRIEVCYCAIENIQLLIFQTMLTRVTHLRV